MPSVGNIFTLCGIDYTDLSAKDWNHLHFSARSFLPEVVNSLNLATTQLLVG